ncbi:MAG: MMPL family transporter, partial [Pontiellaceae bacterium]|nr:MMPL family transporter [Pontiellaceae bacterium]
MRRLKMTSFSIRLPWLIMALSLAAVAFFGIQFPKVGFDNDPENMLSENEPVRVIHNKVKQRYNLYDFVIVGIVNQTNPDGIFNVDTLGKMDQLTQELLDLHQNADGKPETLRDGKPFVPELEPKSFWKRTLAKVFGNDVNDLFDEKGAPAIIKSEIISPSVVDNIRQADQGQLAIEYLMERAPTTREEALAIRDDAMNNPLYNGTLVSEDGKAIALYIPIKAKTYSYNVANLVEKLTQDWGNENQVFITGQPVAQDTFGIEMLVQMASSAPLAGLAIFLLLLFFFRRISLIIAPMLVAVISVVVTMGLLIGLGYPVHIMSSMIAIFLMPISVADSVHILSEFFDTYPRFRDKAETIKHVIGHLFMPMLYTSLTTIAGFASLVFTPIPPVRVFGAHVAFGVALAWVLTMTFVPAYIMLFVRTKMLDQLKPATDEPKVGLLGRSLSRLGALSYRRWKAIIFLTAAILAVSVYGISRININDNPVKWFTKNHRIRVADDVLNSHFGGTYTAYLTLKPKSATTPTCTERTEIIRNAIVERFGETYPDETAILLARLDEANTNPESVPNYDEDRCFVDLAGLAAELDESASGAWYALGDTIAYLEPEGLTFDDVLAAIEEEGDEKTRVLFESSMKPYAQLSGIDLQDQALEITDRFTELSFRDALFEIRANSMAPAFKQPEMLAYVERLQQFLASLKKVGKTSSAVDALKKANYELNYDAGASEERNAAYYTIPPTPAAVGPVFFQLEGTKKKDSLFHLITKEYNELNLWIQLKSGDNTDMQTVVDQTEQWIAQNPPPEALDIEWAGLTYINVKWQDKMVAGMRSSLLSSFVVVLIMMMVLFR